ncbi:PilT/PilU family type 4a pilus ATPase [Comamonas sp. SCN 65-56]|uniref:PilT/PilU family type 4a pilus ATPase n=1 Tax=Comamonas sp. SCN 65-56 TaxID=1660095 RepID=UPI000ADE9148|nr:PilT/PilU family type 4a pilus ATPase [Comamonas sp. SCN 65-56]
MADLAAVPDARLLSWLAMTAQSGASDLFLLAGAPPTVKNRGEFHPLSAQPLQAQQVRELALSLLTPTQRQEFELKQERDLALEAPGVGRFRVNLLFQRGTVGLVARYVPATVAPLQTLKLPPVLGQIVQHKSGLVLAVGAAGSGKTTTLASMIDQRNRTATGHILTIEDPIEYLHEHRQSLVSQREVGTDTHSYDEALRHAMREAPNTIMIGEIRDRNSLQHAMHYAESGHLCLSTLHAANASQAIHRILNFFPDSAHRQVLMDLSLNVRAIIALRLIRSAAGTLVPATEVMLQTARIADLIRNGEIDELRSAISRGGEPGMGSFDQSLFELYRQGVIAEQDAVAHADSRTDMTVRIRLSQGHDPGASLPGDTGLLAGWSAEQGQKGA